MNELEKLDKRWKELVGKPRSKEQIEESLLVAKQLEIEMAKEVNDLLEITFSFAIPNSSVELHLNLYL